MKISIITPTFNEFENVADCVSAISELMSHELPDLQYEHIFVDNASTDGTLNLLKEIALSSKNIRIFSNSRNVGAQKSIYEVLKYSTGDFTIPMLAADLQDPAEIIPQMIREIKQGKKVVFGIRKNRIENLYLRNIRKIYYFLISRLSFASIPENAGEFLMMSDEIKVAILSSQDHNPYIRGMVAQSVDLNSCGFVEYTMTKRKYGESKAPFSVLIDVAINGLVSTSRIPARVSLIIGFLISFISFGIAGIEICLRFLTKNHPIPGVSTLIFAIFFFSGVQLFFSDLLESMF